MDKFCIFCGNPPESKNKEHIIPQWLLKMTGDATKPVHLGMKWNRFPPESRRFNLSALTFPSCTKCNERFSSLEASAKKVVTLLLHRNPVGAHDFDVLLDWLDKVRIGTWLAMMYLNNNYRGIRPMFHIQERIGRKDRFIILYGAIDDGQKVVALFSTDTPIFHLMPCCFGLVINNLAILNASKESLFSERAGLPFAQPLFYREDSSLAIQLIKGTQIRKFPLVSKKFRTGGTELYQPILPDRALLPSFRQLIDVAPAYDNDYVRANCLDYSNGKGIILRRERDRLVQYPDTPSLEWVPQQRFRQSELMHEISIMSGAYIEELYLSDASLRRFPEERQQHANWEVKNVLKVHRIIMKQARSLKKRDV